MARKSKDFNELMKQKQSSQEKHKNLEALREKMQEEGIFGDLYPIHLENLSFAVEKTIGLNLDGV
jgi:hypothetical protein